MTKTKNKKNLFSFKRRLSGNKIGGASKSSTFSSSSLEMIKNNRQKLHAIVNRSLVFVICISIVSYVVTINDLSIKGFILEDLKKDIATLEVENEQFELDAMTLESFELINDRARNLGMVKVDDIQYVSVVDGAVAIK